ncbi:hypothetical protein PG993_014269 [Apiospora rasikravindrae]|uniref:Uncharacterized protein n=1 Tax=Apiospora rasikravindrae TaxID=990691 RepID=A0ABR1RM87_9PEZI
MPPTGSCSRNEPRPQLARPRRYSAGFVERSPVTYHEKVQQKLGRVTVLVSSCALLSFRSTSGNCFPCWFIIPKAGVHSGSVCCGRPAYLHLRGVELVQVAEKKHDVDAA